MSNWWGNKLTGAPTAPARPAAYDPAPRPPQGYQPPAPFGGQQQPQAPAPPPQSYAPPDPGDPNGHLRNVWNYQGNPRGGAGETATLGSCPDCGSARFFSRTNAGGVMNANTGMTVYPSPECADCGYPNQQGVLAGSAGKVTGPASPARAAETPAPMGSLASLRQQG
jgi:hypothetical protein